MRIGSKVSAVALAMAALATSGAAQAQTVDVSVIGTIIPEACTPTVSGGGVIDYGKISASTINQTDYTALPVKQESFSIQCTAPVKAAVTAVDNRASTMVPNILSILGGGFTDDHNFGLGSVSGANIGGYVMRVPYTSVQLDGVAGRTLASVDGGQTWATSGGAIRHAAGTLSAWDDGSSLTPIAFTNMTGDFTIQAVINKGEDLPLTNDIPFDGNATIEVKYL